MGNIAVLEQNMVNMIAAGEVIERPASVAKELMENSIDAGATSISVCIEQGGKKSISVTDNGHAMDSEDLANAFEPHATSKIKKTSDLHGIATLGFRGEALASVASVARVKAVSRPPGQTEANSIEIEAGAKGRVVPCSADQGTTINIRDLFYRQPVRRKFLKTVNTEAGHVTEHFTRIALANPGIDMTLTHNNREIYRLSSRDNIIRRIEKLFSSEIAQNLIETSISEKQIRISALLGRPSMSRTSNKLQYAFLNGRFIRDKFISHAIKEAYRGTLEQNRYPVVFLFIRMPPDAFDVNVHPTKIEVRFYNANLVHSQILSCIREKLLSCDLDIPGKIPPPVGTGKAAIQSVNSREHREEIADAMADFFKKYKPIGNQKQFSPKRDFTATASRRSPLEKNTQYIADSSPRAGEFLQIHDSYIVTPVSDGFVVIDQHALHERIIYEKISNRLQNGKLESQKLLIPESFELTEAEAAILDSHSELLEKLGIELVPFGPKAMAVHSFPVIMSKAQPVEFVQDLIDLLKDKTATIEHRELMEQVMSMAACKAAIKAGQKLTEEEISQLVADRNLVSQPGRCPHGRPTTIKFPIFELEKQFKRT